MLQWNTFNDKDIILDVECVTDNSCKHLFVDIKLISTRNCSPTRLFHSNRHLSSGLWIQFLAISAWFQKTATWVWLSYSINHHNVCWWICSLIQLLMWSCHTSSDSASSQIKSCWHPTLACELCCEGHSQSCWSCWHFSLSQSKISNQLALLDYCSVLQHAVIYFYFFHCPLTIGWSYSTLYGQSERPHNNSGCSSQA